MLTLLLGSLTAPAAAQVNGSASLLLDVLPDPDARAGLLTATELRARVVIDARRDVGEHWRFNLAAHADGLVADRNDASGTTTAATAGPLDIFAEYVTSRVEVRAGASRLTWGRLDELQPTDVVNPIDLTRFLLEGRSEARLAVGLVRTRLFVSSSTTLEAVVVPFFRASTFDQLDEETSPFNLLNGAGGIESGGSAARNPPDAARDRATRLEPEAAWENVQGGVRLTSTIGAFDWGMSAYRGFRTFAIVSVGGPPVDAGGLPAGPGSNSAAGSYSVIESFPRFTMIGGDFETVRGEWGVRGEVAVFADDERQSTRLARAVSGKSVEGGIGVDRRAGDYRLAANVLWSWWGTDPTDTYAPLPAGDAELDRTDFSVVVAADRSFARETRTLRVFAVYDPADATAFVRVIGAVSLRDNLWLEGSGGLFAGEAPDTIGRLTRRDFLYARLKVFF